MLSTQISFGIYYDGSGDCNYLLNICPAPFPLCFALILRSIPLVKVTGVIRTKMVQLKKSPEFLLDVREVIPLFIEYE